MTDDLIVTARLTVPGEDLRWSAERASGPGGQNVNKVATKVELRFNLGQTRALSEAQKARLRTLAGHRLDSRGIVHITSDATRSQQRNLMDARERLRQLIVAALTVPKRRRATKPSKGAKRRRMDAKRRNSEKKKMRGRVRTED